MAFRCLSFLGPGLQGFLYAFFLHLKHPMPSTDVTFTSLYMPARRSLRLFLVSKGGSGGKAIIVARPFGMARAMRYVTDTLLAQPPDPGHPIYVMYSYDRDNALKPAEKIRQAGFSIEERRIAPVGAVAGAHVGRSACAIAYIRA